MFLQTVFALVAVCGLAWVIFRVVLPRLQLINASSGMIRVVERVNIDAKKSLLIIEINGKWMLVGASDNGVNLVSEIDRTDAEAAEADIRRRRDEQFQKIENLRSGFAEKLASVMSRKDVKNDADNKK